MALIKWTPLLEPFDDMDKWFDNWPANFNGQMGGFAPAIDIWQDKDNVYAETPLPGIDPEKVNISIKNDVLTIEGKMEKKMEVEEKAYYRKEVRYGSFHRVVALPTSVNGDAASAGYQNGVLKITIPKEERAKPKTIKVAVNKK